MIEKEKPFAEIAKVYNRSELFIKNLANEEGLLLCFKLNSTVSESALDH